MSAARHFKASKSAWLFSWRKQRTTDAPKKAPFQVLLCLPSREALLRELDARSTPHKYDNTGTKVAKTLRGNISPQVGKNPHQLVRACRFSVQVLRLQSAFANPGFARFTHTVSQSPPLSFDGRDMIRGLFPRKPFSNTHELVISNVRVIILHSRGI